MAKKPTSANASSARTQTVPSPSAKSHRQPPTSTNRDSRNRKTAQPAKESASASPSTTLSGLDAAHAVLVSSGTPMNVHSITKAIFAKKLWTTNGKTPHATIAAAIMREIANKGVSSRFLKSGRGQFAASSTTPAGTTPPKAPKATSRSQSTKTSAVEAATTPAAATSAPLPGGDTGERTSAKRGPEKQPTRDVVAKKVDRAHK